MIERRTKRCILMLYLIQHRGLITQEKGMRLHYDQTLPKIMEELTGEKGKVVDFGEHKNAFQ
jgi:hypothetical protein